MNEWVYFFIGSLIFCGKVVANATNTQNQKKYWNFTSIIMCLESFLFKQRNLEYLLHFLYFLSLLDKKWKTFTKPLNNLRIQLNSFHSNRINHTVLVEFFLTPIKIGYFLCFWHFWCIFWHDKEHNTREWSIIFPSLLLVSKNLKQIINSSITWCPKELESK